MSNIEDLNKKVQSLEDQLNAARKSLHAAMIEAYPIKVGMIVKNPSKWSKGTHFLVDSLKVKYGRVHILGRKKLKSGKFHATAFEEFNSEWEIVSESVSR